MNKLIKSTTMLASIAILTPLALAQATAPTSITTLIDSHLHSSDVVTQRIGILHNVFGKKDFNLDIRGFLGVNLSDGNALTSGLSIGPVNGWRIANEVTFNFAPFVGQTVGKKLDAGIIFYISFNFGG